MNAVDLHNNKTEYLSLYKANALSAARVTAYNYAHRVHETSDPEIKGYYNVSNSKEVLEDIKDLLSPEDYDGLVKEHETFCETVLKENPEKLNELAEKEEENTNAIEVKVIVRKERAAWAYALRAIRQMRDKKIIVVGKMSNEDILNIVNACLGTYQTYYKPYFKTEQRQFLKVSR
jgi:hypothetical protein